MAAFRIHFQTLRQRNAGLFRTMAFESDLPGNVVALLPADLFKLLAPLLQLLVDLDGLLGHLLVSVLGTAHQGEIGARGDTLMAVGIEPHAKYHALALLFWSVARHDK